MIRFMLVVFLFVASCYASDDATAAEFVANYTRDAAPVYNAQVIASWNYNTNLTDENAAKVSEESVKAAEFTNTWGAEAKSLFPDEVMDTLTDESVKRQIESIKILGSANLEGEQLDDYNRIAGEMDKTYSTARAVMPDGRELLLDPDLTEIMRSSRDYEELKFAWKGWYEAAGRPIKDDYEQFVGLSNTASKLDGFADTGAYWRSWYEMDDLEGVADDLWNQLRPLYMELHAYVRRKLYENYGPDYVNLQGPIPAHLLGNMWAQQWNNIYDLVEPYSGQTGVDATPNMIAQGYDAQRMFETSEEFFTSLGLEAMTDEFWNNSMIVRPDDRDVVCHASAWDFYNGNDFRIKQCTTINMEDLITVHHEMGHIQYFQQYMDQPIPFRSGANPGFHEAVGDTLALAVSTPAHLYEIGLLNEVEDTQEADINYLLSQALEKIAFLPFGFLIDKWRWSVFDGSTTKAEYQQKWDDLRLEYQGIVPPVTRDPVKDFDPGAKYHIPGNTPYIRYFVSFVIQFQFYQSMCEASGQEPSYKCDFYRSKEAGTKLAEMLKLGSSKPWPVAMEKLIGSRDMDASALINYFQPLIDWLKTENDKNNEERGWPDTQWRPKDLDYYEDFLTSYNSTAEDEYYNAVVAEWNYNTNINEDTQAAAQAASERLAKFQAEQADIASSYDLETVTDETQKRLLSKISVKGSGALDTDDLQELSTVEGNMQTTYSTAKVDGKPLDPDLTLLMANSRDYNELRDAWHGWREQSGKKMRGDFNKYIDLQNKVADLNGYNDMGEFWRSAYETPGIEDQFEAVWQDMLPLYQQLHAYIRRKLIKKYGSDVINPKGPIPAHLLGNMWAQDWGNIYEIAEPYSGKVRPDATPGLQSWSIEEMFHVADDFFRDMGLIPCPDEFWAETQFVRPDDREVICHASAWDFYNRKDFRVKMCTIKTQQDFVTIHHELGHIQYYLQYKDQPVSFRDGANPGFHEAVGDTLSLSVGTLDHLYKLGLIDKPSDDDQSDINYLMSMALEKLAFLPFGYLMDKYRWDVFSERVSKENLNQAWWDYRVKYQGVAPPTDRSELDFDPGAKFHIANDVPYIRYFVSGIVQFQFYEALCNEAGHEGPLYKCDFNGTIAAGDKLGAMLRLGSSKTWEEALEQVAGTRVMDSAALVKYFQPLLDYLSEENAKNKEVIGWPEYSWQPPTNTYQVNGDGIVYLDDGNAGSTILTNTWLIGVLAFSFMWRLLLE